MTEPAEFIKEETPAYMAVCNESLKRQAKELREKATRALSSYSSEFMLRGTAPLAQAYAAAADLLESRIMTMPPPSEPREPNPLVIWMDEEGHTWLGDDPEKPRKRFIECPEGWELVREVQPGQGGEGLNYVLRMVQAYATHLDGTGDEIGAKQIRANLDRYYGAYMSGEPEQSMHPLMHCPKCKELRLLDHACATSEPEQSPPAAGRGRALQGGPEAASDPASPVAGGSPAPSPEQWRYFKDADGTRWRFQDGDEVGQRMDAPRWLASDVRMPEYLNPRIVARDGSVETDEHGSPLVKGGGQ